MQIGSLTTLWHDHIDCIDDYNMPPQKKSILINEHALNCEPVCPFKLTVQPKNNQVLFSLTSKFIEKHAFTIFQFCDVICDEYKRKLMFFILFD